ncbi:hypothetical protein F6V30_09820 [Oryzomonas sagensis]|uniref:Uncharacterized protein n=1 Tax=Oryzomonas sagensis TaxID=2603857 RepID=A0ABQ6TP61_9BACT|nr:hypothetical protein [Oryzomonas sagensis]KAB0670436.1 hypothetical protein F6V30_09820 [Oryzomonas sagensis]
MNRFKLFLLAMNRFRLLVVTTCIVVVAASSLGIGATYAQQDSGAVPLTPEQKAAAERRDKAAAIRAREQRDAAIKKRQDAKKYIKKVVEGQESGTAAPDTTGKGGGQ